MQLQLHLWGDSDELGDEQTPVEYPTPAEPEPESLEPTTLDQDLRFLYYDYLGKSAQRIATALESNRKDRTAQYMRLVGYEFAIGRLTAEQRNMLYEIVRGDCRYQ